MLDPSRIFAGGVYRPHQAMMQMVDHPEKTVVMKVEGINSAGEVYGYFHYEQDPNGFCLSSARIPVSDFVLLMTEA